MIDHSDWPRTQLEVSPKRSDVHMTCDTCGGPINLEDDERTVTCIRTGKLLPRWNDDDWHHEVSSDE